MLRRSGVIYCTSEAGLPRRRFIDIAQAGPDCPQVPGIVVEFTPAGALADVLLSQKGEIPEGAKTGKTYQEALLDIQSVKMLEGLLGSIPKCTKGVCQAPVTRFVVFDKDDQRDLPYGPVCDGHPGLRTREEYPWAEEVRRSINFLGALGRPFWSVEETAPVETSSGDLEDAAAELHRHLDVSLGSKMVTVGCGSGKIHVYVVRITKSLRSKVPTAWKGFPVGLIALGRVSPAKWAKELRKNGQ